MRALVLVVFAVGLLSGCSSVPERDRNTAMGILAGAGVGAAIGTATSGPTGTWVGAAIGGAAGGLVGYLIRPDGCFYRNRRGELWQVPCEGKFVGNAACYVGNDIGGLRQVPCPNGRRS
jgi:hypothetical protein